MSELETGNSTSHAGGSDFTGFVRIIAQDAPEAHVKINSTCRTAIYPFLHQALSMVRHSIKKLLQSSLQAFLSNGVLRGPKLFVDRLHTARSTFRCLTNEGEDRNPHPGVRELRNASILLLPSSICGLLLFGAGVAAVGAHMFRITSEGSTTAILGQWRPTPLCAEPLQLRDGRRGNCFNS